MDKEATRKAFEEWAISEGYVVLRADAESFHTFELQHVEDIWHGWQAAIAHSCEGKAELAQMLRELANTARGSVEFDDWPELQASIANAESALSRHGG